MKKIGAKYILYSWKYWQSLNLTVWPQTECKKKTFKFGGGASQRITSSQTLHMSLSRSVAFLLLEVLELSHEFADLQEI